MHKGEHTYPSAYTRTVLNQIDAPLTPTNVLVETDRDAAKGSPHSFHDKTTMVIAARLKW